MIRVFRHYISGIYLILLLLEAGVFYAAFYIGFAMRFYPSMDLTFEESLIVPSSIFMMVMLVSSTGMGLYQRAQGWGDAGILLRILGSFMLGTIIMSLVFYAIPKFFVGRGVFGYALLSALAGVSLFRFLFYQYVDRQDLKRRVLVIGAGSNARKIYDMEKSGRNQNFHVIGYVRLNDEPCHIDMERIIQLRVPLNEYTNQQDIDEIVVAPDDRRRGFAVDEILDCKMTGYEVVDLLTFFEREAGIIKVDCLHPSWLVFSDGFRLSGLSLVGKRGFDIVASLTLLVLAWPVMLITALAIMIESGRRAPVFYKQVRVGINWELFKVIKFRSMRTDAEKDGRARWASKNDDRITRVGQFIRKSRIDELPQLFNVLRGDMSFVGPRPERPEFVERFAETIPYYSERHRVKPGITGWAQLCYPYGSTEQDAIEKLQYDLYYVKNYSLFLDLLIMLQTIEVVLWGKGAR
jgi:sugar transferase (PEP-CTERM system associated)